MATKCADEDEFIRRFHPFAGSEALAIPGTVPATEGTEGRFVIALRDQRPIMQGRCRIGGVETLADGTRTRVLLTLLEQDPRSRRVHERLLSRRRVMGMDVTAVPVSQPKKNPSLKLGGAAAARETPQETRTPGSAYQLPANPLSHLQEADLASFVECTLFEEATAAPPAEPSEGMPVPLKALPPEPQSSPEKGRTKLFFTAGQPSTLDAKEAAAEFDNRPTQPQEPSLLHSALRASKQDSDPDLPAAKRSLLDYMEDEPTTPGFDNPTSAIRHLFLHPQGESPEASAAAAESLRPSPLPPTPVVHPPEAARRTSALLTAAAHTRPWLSAMRALWAKVPPSARGPLKKWGPTAAIAFAMFWLGFGARGKPPAVEPAAPVRLEAVAVAPSALPVTKAPYANAAAEAPAAEAAPAAMTCVATIRSMPAGAGVKWGDAILGRTPLVGVSVPCGMAAVSVQRLMFADYQTEATAIAETPAVLDVKLKRLQSRLDISADPEGALVIVNKRRIGPAPQQVNVPRGLAAIVQLSHVGFRPVTKRVAPRDDAFAIAAKLQPLKPAKKLAAKKLAAKKLAAKKLAAKPVTAAAKTK